jgi:hypothetical protein
MVDLHGSCNCRNNGDNEEPKVVLLAKAMWTHFFLDTIAHFDPHKRGVDGYW